MELKWLEYFVVSVDAGSLSKAAEILYTTQPNVSKIIKELEDSLGVLLLERGRRGVVMTEEGQQIYKYARQMLECRENISDTLRRSRRQYLSAAFMLDEQLETAFANAAEGKRPAGMPVRGDAGICNPSGRPPPQPPGICLCLRRTAADFQYHGCQKKAGIRGNLPGRSGFICRPAESLLSENRGEPRGAPQDPVCTVPGGGNFSVCVSVNGPGRASNAKSGKRVEVESTSQLFRCWSIQSWDFWDAA